MNIFTSRQIRLALGTVAVCSLAWGTAQAALEATPYVSYRVLYDDNVLRHRDEAEAAAQSGNGSSQLEDTIQTYAAGLELDYTFGNQRLFMEGSADTRRYSEFSILDFDGNEFKGGFEWKLGSNLNGDILAERTRDLRDFSNFSTGIQRSIETRTDQSAGLKFKFLRVYEVYSRFARHETENSLTLSQREDYEEDLLTFGVSYVGRTGLNIGLESKFADGEYVERVPREEYDQRTYQLVVGWVPSPISKFGLSIGSTERDNEAANQGDFSGATGALSYDRTISPKSGFGLSIKRDVSSVDQENQNFAVVTGATLTLFWNPVPKVSTNLFYVNQQEDYRGQPAGVQGREDDYQIAGVKMDYEVGRYFVLSPDLGFEDRSSNLPSQEYDSFRVGLTLRAQYPIR